MNRIKFARDDIYDFLKSLDLRLSIKIFSLLEVLDEVGVYLDSSKLKKVHKYIYELRVVGKIQVRVLCTFREDKIFVLHAFVKKTQKIPKKELDTAIHRLNYLH